MVPDTYKFNLRSFTILCNFCHLKLFGMKANWWNFELIDEVAVVSAKTIPVATVDAENVIINPVAEITKEVEELTVEDKKNEELEKTEATGESAGKET